jgi:ADP-ribosylglycohydrolase
MHETHVLNNAGALAAAVLHGDGDFAATVGLAVQAKLDTDSIGATAGSWAGAFLGYDALPKRLVDPLEDLARTAVFGVGDVRISELVERTLILHACLQ